MNLGTKHSCFLGVLNIQLNVQMKGYFDKKTIDWEDSLMIRKGQPQWKVEQRRLKEGRGQGHGVDYQPYIKTYDFSSKGVRTRSLGWKTGRHHHFMSRDEYHYFLTLEFSDRVVDIREQYPLLPKERTIEIAKELNVSHPSDDNGDPVVMTTDFNITVLGEHSPEDLQDVIRTLKPSLSS